MRKRNILLIIFIVTILLIVISVINLSIKNSKLKFMSDDSRQIELAKELYPEFILKNSNDGNANITGDLSVYRNFINYTIFTASDKTRVDEIFTTFSSSEENRNYTISAKFDIDKLVLTLTLSNDDLIDYNTYSYKLDIDKKNNKITYKKLDQEEHVIE
ncbi:MAG: hypothetical protein J6A15_09020 [Clostridia bacterium]|nr:hypothetical protein [Clostridia bacterium]